MTLLKGNHESCIFCKIIRKEIKASILYEDESILAFKDIAPKAPVHFLVVTKTHIESLLKVDASHQALLGHLNLKLAEIAKSQGLGAGFKIMVNTGEKGGQEVMHLHYHILGTATATASAAS